MRVAAVIPAFNEEATVAAVVEGARRYVPEVVVVDDGSTDRTADRAAHAGARLIRLPQNRGKGGALRAGLANVLALGCSHVLLMDADLQHDPEDIPRLLSAAGSADLVLAERVFVKESMPAARYYSNVIGSQILSCFIGRPVADSQSGFRLVAADLLQKLTLTATGYEIETEMLIKLARSGARIARLPIRARYDGKRSKLRPFRDTFRTCMLAVRYRYLPGR